MAVYGDGLLLINNTELVLNSGLSEKDFAQSRLAQYLTDAGYIYSPRQDGSYKVTEYRFSGTKIQEKSDNEKSAQSGGENSVLILGDPFVAKPLLAFLESCFTSSNPNLNNAAETAVLQAALQRLNAVQAAVEWNLKNEDKVPLLKNTGPMGILAAEDGSLLFLPFPLFERSVLSRGEKNASLLYGCWVNTALSHKASWRFTLSACAYRLFCGKKAFSGTHTEQRAEDYYDTNFIPIEHCLNFAADDEETKKNIRSINYNLSLKTGMQSLPLAPLGLPKTKNIDENFTKEQKRFIEKQQRKIKLKRFLRKKGSLLLITAAVVLIISLAAASIIKTNLDGPNTKGMTPVQVVQTFYQAINRLDNLVLDSCGEKKAIQTYSNMVATLFVTGKMREAYERTVPFLTPAQWLTTADPLQYWVFGLSRLEMEAPSPWNARSKKGDTVDFIVRFYLFANKGPENYELSAHTDRLRLTYGKNQWQISSLTTDTADIFLDSSVFREDMLFALSQLKAQEANLTSEQIKPEQRALRLQKLLLEKYTWLPASDEILQAAKELPIYLWVPEKN